MKYRRVFGSTARYALSSYYQGLWYRSSFASHTELTISLRYLHTSLPQCHDTHDTWAVRPFLPPSKHLHEPTQSGHVPVRDTLRTMMRLIPHSVVVCTSRSGSASRGITVSSFNSLSLEPPIVTFHVATPSRTLDAIRASGRLNIHILTGDVEGAKIAHHFAGNVAAGRPFQEEDLLAAGVRQVVTEDEEDVPVGPPMLSGPGVLYVLSCKLYDKEHNGIVTVSDHAIVLGEILDIGMGNTVPGRHDNFGLVYADRHYRQLGSTLARTPKR